MNGSTKHFAKLNLVNKYTNISIFANNFYHDKIYSPTTFNIIINDTIGEIFYISNKDSYKHCKLSSENIQIFNDFIKINQSYFYNFNSDERSSLYVIIENFEKDSLISKNFIVFKEISFIDKCYFDNPELKCNFESYNLFIEELRKLVSFMRCN